MVSGSAPGAVRDGRGGWDRRGQMRMVGASSREMEATSGAGTGHRARTGGARRTRARPSQADRERAHLRGDRPRRRTRGVELRREYGPDGDYGDGSGGSRGSRPR